MTKRPSKSFSWKTNLLLFFIILLAVSLGFYFYNQNKIKALYQEQPTEQEIFPGSTNLVLGLETEAGDSKFTVQEFRLGFYRMALYYPVDESGAPNKAKAPFPVVVFHHGMAAKYAYYPWIAAEFARKGYLVVMPNRLFFGLDMNEGVKVTKLIFGYLNYRNNNSRDKLYHLIDKNNGAVAGHSLGSMVALSTADQTKSVIKIKTIMAFSPGSSDITNSSEMIKKFASLLQNNLIGKSMEASIIKMVQALQQTTIPVLFITGSKDGFCPASGVVDLYNKTSSKKAIAIIEGGNHVQFVQGGAKETEMMTKLDEKATITGEQQREIGLKYFMAWMNYFLKDDQAAKAVLELGKNQKDNSLTLYNLSF